MKTVITIILYNKKVSDSSTLKTISNAKVQGDCIINLVNNGPREVSLLSSEKEVLLKNFPTVDFEEYLDNKPLSMIYNDTFIKYPEFGRFVFFDDDTMISEDFFNMVFSGDSDSICDLKIPSIIEKDTGLTCYPLVNDKVYTGDIPREIKDSKVFSIGSGLVIYRSLVNKFANYGLDVFDDRFALYGVDFSLFRRMNLLKDKGMDFNILICGALKHSLSSSEKSISEWRYRERLIDLILSVKHYPSSKFMFLFMVAKILLREIVRKKGANLNLILDVLCKGEHPRCILFKSYLR